MTEIVKVNMAYVRRTKDLCRYEEEVETNSTPLIGTLYISKTRLGGTAPKRIVVTITGDDDA